jgi:hypothetical protein
MRHCRRYENGVWECPGTCFHIESFCPTSTNTPKHACSYILICVTVKEEAMHKNIIDFTMSSERIYTRLPYSLILYPAIFDPNGIGYWFYQVYSWKAKGIPVWKTPPMQWQFLFHKQKRQRNEEPAPALGTAMLFPILWRHIGLFKLIDSRSSWCSLWSC